MEKYAALIAYSGTEFCGWQVQKAMPGQSPSIQGTFARALKKMTTETASTIGSGRTDAGVHACGQVVHFQLGQKIWEPRILKRGLNSLLPSTIRVREVQRVPADFHAQRSAVKKQYSYYFQQGQCALPHLEPYSWWIQKKLNLEAMNQALNFLKGLHDFLPFRASGAAETSTIREIFEAEVTQQAPGFPTYLGNDHLREFSLIQVRVVGSGFLKQMVRGIAGTLLQIGENRRSAQCMQEILKSGDRKLVGPTAPARALWLERVWYPSLDFTPPK